MKPAPFEYRCARSSEEAVSLLADGDGYNAVLAGGQTLLPLLNLRLVQPDRVVDISRIESMTGCRDERPLNTEFLVWNDPSNRLSCEERLTAVDALGSIESDAFKVPIANKSSEFADGLGTGQVVRNGKR